MKVTDLPQMTKVTSEQVKDADQSAQVKSKQKDQEARTEQLQASDRVELSAESKEAQRIAEAAKAAPDVRGEKVAELKEKVAKGEYQTDSKEVAEKLIIDSLTELI